ncbi:3-hydroxyacyl-CoA dehydrogenase family protein [Roseobacter sp. HKCCD9010]|nr:3-hydroxyacyl-CoA dehydrogenase family protein [Rhodobacterales bacterium HKCCD4356]NNV14034.1 3-hydroxyacyl-CoA dehydrogenase family protein [Roseobacter sp. HKCCD7357]NNV18292.1 3-hydroxyacyl-CoA dehydrogenase family protein [Roseobacter sp. HKCCD8768]NNV27733.1 3-hydroxyacyl-CoA dehydrogenase family protein [Roseobacter sp. HKCCD8192]NNV32008.1 3-hydroxyacyl-CoA dehydrogenase family protein [Roseobacter sp. HKCCD9061]NNV36316.1 3-hydroxyacyl-CoA dehydrogenase family protein [Roseobacter 
MLGAGTMGAQIALSLALGGAEVRLWARQAESLEAALERCGDGFDFLSREGLVAPADRQAVLGRIGVQTGMGAAVAGAGFVIEAAAEDLIVKQDLLSRAEGVAAPEAVLSSTTSALSASDIQSALAQPENFCVAHYAQPAHLVELVEVVPGKATADRTTAFTTAILMDTGKTPVLCPDIPGFLWARIQHAVLREFAALVGQGLVTVEACDTILKVGYASRLPAMGAFEHADLAGLDLINSDAAKAVWADLSNAADPGETPVGTLFAEGKLGMKSGEGFYDWTTRDPDAFKAKRDAEIVRRVKINRELDRD